MAFIGEIQIFGFGYAPPGWALCNGASLPVSGFTPLFSLIGTSYGGDGVRHFQLPNLMGRAACGQGQGNGTSSRRIGDTFGANTAVLATENIPAHGHGLDFFSIPKTTDPVTGVITDNRSNVPAEGYSLALPESKIFSHTASDAKMSNTLGKLEGGTDAHENRQPFGALAYYIMTQRAGGDGVFPVFA
ncbi:phage tail protein [Herbaspirillum rhizosphaerae]|uniref:phage tail protein n=1 Tax=Herbaspirillum rhizosphaerae TaxID=346179 RepID=UPI00067AA1E8|nr:tail fiber protein [Herbaspirillum rhizosphaerae]